MKTFYLTTTIPYVNGAPHLGHAFEFVQADAIFRYHKEMLGEEAYFLTGTDENAIKNVQAADAAKIQTETFVAQNSELFKNLLKKLNVVADDFVRTTEERHFKAATALWRATNPEDIYKKTYEGLYCVGCEQFYKPGELTESGECFEHPGKKVETVSEENYFFRLSRYSSWLKEIITKDEIRIIPEKRKNEILSLIASGLEDFSISRPKERSRGWGVPVPGDDPSAGGQTMYVWYDALVNYITGLGYPDDEKGLFKKFWMENENRVHVLGKGVSRFHALYWPAMLKSAGLPAPTLELVHGYITINGAKMSKTTGNTVDPLEIIEKYGTDAFRFFALHDLSPFEDGDFTWEKFRESYNAHLANGLGNLVSRVMKMASMTGVALTPERVDSFKISRLGNLDRFEVQKAAGDIWRQISETDKFIQETEPFKKVKSDPAQAKSDIALLLTNLLDIAKKLAPFLPETSEKILAALRENSEIKTPLFPRVS